MCQKLTQEKFHTNTVIFKINYNNLNPSPQRRGFLFVKVFICMKILISKEQYRILVIKLLEGLFGELSITTAEEKERLGQGGDDYHDIFDEDGEEIANIWIKGDCKNKGCKRDLTFNNEMTERMENFIPYYKHKMFSKVLIEYVYKYTGVKCDCIQYEYGFSNTHYNDDDDYTFSKTKKYNVKKKKKIK